MKDTRPDSKVTLEEILRFKRAEKPDAAFWTEFEQQFRAKQLAAAVERKRWWFALPRVMPTLVRFSLPVGATAVLALTFVTVRQSQPDVLQSAPEFEETVTRPEASTFAEATMEDAQIDLSTVTAPAPPLVAAIESPDSANVSVSSEGSLAQASEAMSSVRSSEGTPSLSPSARLIAANMAEAKIEYANMLHGRGHEVRVLEEPLAQILVPSETRSSRVLPPQMAQLASYSLENERSAQVTERQARRLSEDQLFDAGRRISAQADRLMLKL